MDDINKERLMSFLEECKTLLLERPESMSICYKGEHQSIYNKGYNEGFDEGQYELTLEILKVFE